ncbi:hypothetical protein [uncultured Gimesia sp.]|uniref:hypothetical protein n=1 Tax=uncultured Gimesia sp. TaxID=1678688 RepID=UPI00262DBFEB|nr:hypothetical protein [uncultured Gimesia sp.]
MRTVFFIVVTLLTAISSIQGEQKSSRTASKPKVEATQKSVDAKSKVDKEKKPAATLKPLTAKQQTELLGFRLKAGIGGTFSRFANMFMVSSRLALGTGVGLMTSSKEIAETPMFTPFPDSYKPTLRELLDTLALQTHSKWKYDPSSKYFKSDIDFKGPFDGIAIFEFTKTKREKPFEITLAKGWKASDEGTWVMYVPPSFRVGMDIYQMGTYSSSEKIADQKFKDKIRLDMAMDWAQRMNKKATLKDLKPAKVGRFDALYYESMVPSQLNKDIRWRQWVFMDGNQCYFVVSTILPEMEDKIFPDVKKMIASFKIKKKL